MKQNQKLGSVFERAKQLIFQKKGKVIDRRWATAQQINNRYKPLLKEQKQKLNAILLKREKKEREVQGLMFHRKAQNQILDKPLNYSDPRTRLNEITRVSGNKLYQIQHQELDNPKNEINNKQFTFAKRQNQEMGSIFQTNISSNKNNKDLFQSKEKASKQDQRQQEHINSKFSLFKNIQENEKQDEQNNKEANTQNFKVIFQQKIHQNVSNDAVNPPSIFQQNKISINSFFNQQTATNNLPAIYKNDQNKPKIQAQNSNLADFSLNRPINLSKKQQDQKISLKNEFRNDNKEETKKQDNQSPVKEERKLNIFTNSEQIKTPRFASNEEKSIFTNQSKPSLFASKQKNNIFTQQSKPSLFALNQKNNINIFTQQSKPSLFVSNEKNNIFTHQSKSQQQKKETNLPSLFAQPSKDNIFSQKAPSNIFTQNKSEENIFKLPNEKNLFSSINSTTKQEPPKQQTNSQINLFSQSKPNIFSTNSQTSSLFSSSASNLFSKQNNMFAVQNKNKEVDVQEDQNQYEQGQDDQQILQDKNQFDPNLSTGNYKYAQNEVFFKQVAEKFKIDNGNLFQSITVSIQKTAQAQNKVIYARKPNKTFLFYGAVIKKATLLKKLANKSLAINHCVRLDQQKQSFVTLKISFKQAKQCDDFFEQINQMIKEE